MTTVTFDSLGYAKRLEKAGFTREQAEIQTDAMREIIEDKLATKADIARLEDRMREMELRITLKLGSMLAASVALIAALVTLVK